MALTKAKAVYSAGAQAMKLYFETSTGHLHKQGEELCGDKVEIVKR